MSMDVIDLEVRVRAGFNICLCVVGPSTVNFISEGPVSDSLQLGCLSLMVLLHVDLRMRGPVTEHEAFPVKHSVSHWLELDLAVKMLLCFCGIWRCSLKIATS